MKNNYTFIDKTLHQVSLNNKFFKEFSFDLEKILFLQKYKNENPRLLFINGLARSGTTALLNYFVDSKIGTSLTYNKLPFIFMPNLIQTSGTKKEASALQERAHGDQIKINENSPEAIDEIFWKFQLQNNFIHQKTLEKHSLKKKDIEEYLNFIKLHLLTTGEKTYITKNNNTILRLESLLHQDKLNSSFIFTIRDPFSHSKSLQKQHSHFSKIHQEDPFSLTYFNTLGHHEFGLNLKYFDLGNADINKELEGLDPNELDYWLLVWLNYHQYILGILNPHFYFISFDSLCINPTNTLIEIGKKLNIELQTKDLKAFQPPIYEKENTTSDLLNRCNEIYHQLKNVCI